LASGGAGPFDFKTGGLLSALTEKAGQISSLEIDAYPLLWVSAKEVAKDIWNGSVRVAGSNLKGDFLPSEEIFADIIKIAPALLAQLEALRGAR
jgi:hypothetical protein